MNKSSSMAGELLREVARLYTRAQRVVADCCETTSTQCHILMELDRSGPLAMNDLGTRLLLEKSWVSRAVDSMVETGLLAKERNPSDARSWMLSLTSAGRQRVKQLSSTLDEHAAQLLASLNERERTDVQHALVVLLNALRQDRSATCCLPAPERRKDPPCC